MKFSCAGAQTREGGPSPNPACASLVHIQLALQIKAVGRGMADLIRIQADSSRGRA